MRIRNQEERKVDPNGYYERLKLPPGSTIEEVNRSFNKLMFKWHADSGTEAIKARNIQDEVKRKAAFKVVLSTNVGLNEARDFLSDKAKKEAYDQGISKEQQESGYGMSSGFDVSDLFNIFGGGSRMPTKVEDSKVTVKISVKDSFLGCKKVVKYKRQVVCKGCKGVGGDKSETCRRCSGKGRITRQLQQGISVFIEQCVCDMCNGEKTVIKGNKCNSCNGNKVMIKEEKFEVTLQKGVKDEDAFKYPKKGSEAPGLEPGNLIVQVSVEKDSKWRRIDDNLVAYIEINLLHALVGTFVDIETFDKRSLRVVVNPVTDINKCFSVRGEGFSNNRGNGDLIIIPQYFVPKFDYNELREISSAPDIKEIQLNVRDNLNSNIREGVPRDVPDESDVEADNDTEEHFSARNFFEHFFQNR
ncbi:hypothetical protein EDEG_02789 [Edhazardia aedis USNM 41457]|uniref:Chaperone DnaJ n=1 Tax=Edhazardia aedis (strain USNM 41457) TaxID=1003232 RepID=J9DJL6_EDHAE|nr:hypothetical protein EDEG_02789 [Edhazardia aedis USNM 41457]|eukprot:EJW02815.1 hypothetical protein EDEG_02789 [Edhazardia aedis USNM 41457]